MRKRLQTPKFPIPEYQNFTHKFALKTVFAHNFSQGLGISRNIGQNAKKYTAKFVYQEGAETRFKKDAFLKALAGQIAQKR